MKRRLFVIAGGVALALTSVLATKANRKFAATVTTAYYLKSSSYFQVFSGASGGINLIVTSGSSLPKAVLQASGTSTLFYHNSAGYHVAYFDL
jgi:hypothetical protein